MHWVEFEKIAFMKKYVNDQLIIIAACPALICIMYNTLHTGVHVDLDIFGGRGGVNFGDFFAASDGRCGVPMLKEYEFKFVVL